MAQIVFTLNDLELVIEKTLQKREVKFSEDRIIALVNISQRRAKKQIKKTHVRRENKSDVYKMKT